MSTSDHLTPAPMQHGAATNGHAPDHARPPGPEEAGGATATSGAQAPHEQSLRIAQRLPLFWISLLLMLALNAVLVSWIFPETHIGSRFPAPFSSARWLTGM